MKTQKSILHVTVKTDQHGNRPSKTVLGSIQRKFNRAVRESGSNHIVVVTDDHVSLKQIA